MSPAGPRTGKPVPRYYAAAPTTILAAAFSVDIRADHNEPTRGQTILNVDESKAAKVELKFRTRAGAGHDLDPFAPNFTAEITALRRHLMQVTS